MKTLLEIAVFNYSSAILAAEYGADRIELCDNAEEGGTTPSYGTLKMVREKLAIPVFPIIRPRGGDFLYSKEEFEVMIRDIKLCKELGFEGVVIGLLNADGTIDKHRTSTLVELAYPLSVTFHRAFDRCNDPYAALEILIETGCERILTSGQRATVVENLPLFKQLVQQSEDRIIMMPGSGIRSNNIIEISATGANEFHSSARKLKHSGMVFSNNYITDFTGYTSVDAEEIMKMKQLLKEMEQHEDV